jgi:outer membrane lipoprotein SlyB
MTQAKRSLSAVWLCAAVLVLSGCFGDDTADQAQAEQTKQSAAPAAAPPVCADCGRVTAIDKVTVKGEGTGAGAVGGAIVGVVVGNQIGSGSGKDVAKVIGGVGGAVAGHEAEKRLRATTYHQVTVAMETGSTRVIEVTDASMLAVGDEVRVQGTNIVLR